MGTSRVRYFAVGGRPGQRLLDALLEMLEDRFRNPCVLQENCTVKQDGTDVNVDWNQTLEELGIRRESIVSVLLRRMSRSEIEADGRGSRVKVRLPSHE